MHVINPWWPWQDCEYDTKNLASKLDVPTPTIRLTFLPQETRDESIMMKLTLQVISQMKAIEKNFLMLITHKLVLT